MSRISVRYLFHWGNCLLYSHRHFIFAYSINYAVQVCHWNKEIVGYISYNFRVLRFQNLRLWVTFVPRVPYSRFTMQYIAVHIYTEQQLNSSLNSNKHLIDSDSYNKSSIFFIFSIFLYNSVTASQTNFLEKILIIF